MKPAIAFDATGVLFKSNKALARSRDALLKLKQRNIPFVVLTNAGGRTEE